MNIKREHIINKSFSIVGIRHYTGINEFVRTKEGELVIENNNIVLKTTNGNTVGSMASSDSKIDELKGLGVPEYALTSQRQLDGNKAVFDGVVVKIQQHIPDVCVVVEIIEKGDKKMKIKKLEEEIKYFDENIKNLQNALDAAEEARYTAKMAVCLMQSDLELEVEVQQHEFQNEVCVMQGWKTFDYKVIKDGKIIGSDTIGDYHELPIIKGDDTTQYCCGTFQLNEKCVAHHLYNRAPEWYFALCKGIEKYLADNYLGCGACE